MGERFEGRLRWNSVEKVTARHRPLPIQLPLREQNRRPFGRGFPQWTRGSDRFPFPANTVLGERGFHQIEWEDSSLDIGYWIAPWARRRRAATRAVVLLSQWALGNLEMERISLLTFPGNVASEGVAAAAGYTREGVLRSYLAVRGERRDTTVWSLIAADLEA